jgi:hypothetical protein
MGFDIVLVLSVLTPLLALPWVWFTLPKGFSQPRWRSWVGFASLAAVTLETLVFIAAALAVGRIEGFDEKVQFWIAWMRINRIICLVIIFVGLFGKGRFRWATLSTALALIFYAVFVYEMK